MRHLLSLDEYDLRPVSSSICFAIVTAGSLYRCCLLLTTFPVRHLLVTNLCLAGYAVQCNTHTLHTLAAVTKLVFICTFLVLYTLRTYFTFLSLALFCGKGLYLRAACG